MRRLTALVACLIVAGNVAAADDALAAFAAYARPPVAGDLAPTVVRVVAGSPAAAAGVVAGDRLVAVAGRRVHALPELRLLWSLLPPDAGEERWVLVGADGAAREVVVHGDGVGQLGVAIDPADPGSAAAQALEAAGVALAAADLASARLLPARAVQAIVDVARAGGGVPAWLPGLLADWRAARDPASAPAAAAPTLPDAWLTRIDGFWRAIARRQADGDAAPDLAAYGVDAATFALACPWPAAEAVAFGRPALGGDRLARLLQGGSLAARRAEAVRGLGDYVGQVAASLLDPENHGGWPYRSGRIMNQASRDRIVADLRQRYQAGGDDRELVAYALLGPLTIEGRTEEVQALLADLAERSPWLAWRATTMVGYAAGMHAKPAIAAAASAVARDRSLPPLPARVAIYAWCADRSSALAAELEGLDYGDEHGAPAVMRARPDLVAAAFAPEAPLAGALDRERQRLLHALNNTAWALAVDPAIADAEQARDAAAAMAACGGRALPAFMKDTVAACWARAGDFAAAQRWQAAATGEAGDANETRGYAQRQALYAAGQAFAEGAPAAGAMTDVALPAGGKDHGRVLDGERVGAWTRLRADGSVESLACLRERHPVGLCAWFDGAGKRRFEARYALDGKRLGRWRRFDPPGVLREEGDCLDDRRCGRWRWYDERGRLVREGWFVGGVPAGPWRKLAPEGAVVAETWFDDGRATGAWDDEVPLEPTPPPLAVDAPPAQSDF